MRLPTSETDFLTFMTVNSSRKRLCFVTPFKFPLLQNRNFKQRQKMNNISKTRKPIVLFQNLEIRICRLCLSKTQTFFSLVNSDKNSEMLEALTSIKILPTDKISTVMCLKCLLQLKYAYAIQQRMLKAEERFHHLASIKEEDNSKEVNCEVILIEEEIKSELPLQSFVCEYCDKAYPSKTLLAKHRYFHKKAKCPICEKECGISNLKDHIQVHNTTPVVCELCGVTLKNKNNLRQHIFYSHNESRHKCQFCDKVYKKKLLKDAHEQKEHLGVANFVCDTCGKSFFKRRSLTTHVKMTHLKLRPYVCEFCNRGFSSLFALKTHKRQHTNETPYKCEICGEGFRQKVTLKTHKKSKHNIIEAKTCECSVCGKGFASGVALYTHMRVHK